MKSLIIAAALAGALTVPAFAQPPAAPAAPAAAPAAPAAAGKLSPASSLRALMAAPAAKAVLNKHIPMVVAFLEMAGDMLPEEFTLEALAQVEQAGITPELLKAMGDDLAKL